jgi:hypothetical protein
MAWNVTALAAKVGKTLGLRRRWRDASAVARSMRLVERSSAGLGSAAIVRAYERALASLAEEERFRLTKAMVDLDADGKAVTQRALASGAPADAVIALARAWPDLLPVERSLALGPVSSATPGPVTIAGVPARQVDATTCGAAAMAIMLMIGDPFVGLWVASGRTFAHYRPPEIARIEGRAWLTEPVQRWEALQRSIHVDTVRHGFLLLVPWPRTLGTPPWRVDNRTRFAGLRFQGAIVDDTDTADLDALISHATAAISDGIPVPLYASGDSSRGLDTVVPRHVVLLTHRIAGGFLAYEPGSARLHVITDAQLHDGGEGLKALGNWSHVSWMILPQAKKPWNPTKGTP